ncbi:MAG: chemotaxis protein [Leptothrix sp. (in: Bacteria)]|jgi:methyl-accepting chemotaxis protein|nr:chemotaxis protein [Leptothrix sp. (in: b-proteobacteria)]
MAYTYVPDEKPSLGVLGDNTLLIAIGISAVIAIILGGQFANPRPAVTGTVLLLGLTGLAYSTARGSLLSRMLLTTVLVSFVTLHIHVARGMAEFHFGVFATLALLLVYRDWRPIAAAATMFIALQVGLDRLQALGYPVFSLDRADGVRTALHVLFILAQASAEIILARNMGSLAAEGDELALLVAGVDRGDRIDLNVSGVQASTPGGLALKKMLEKMDAAVSVLRRGTSSMNVACVEIATGNQDLSERTEQTAANLQRTTTSMVDLTRTARRSDESATQADTLARSACGVATDGGQVIAEVVETMKGISESSARIADIIGMIDGIAFQTNILALNAAVEAARAGEQGRGFAVVAAEVRSLASRSGEAAKEIRSLIGDSVERVSHGASLMDRAGSTMGDIVTAVQRVAEIMTDLGGSSRHQAGEISQLGNVMSQMDQATQQNAAMVEQMAAAAASLRAQADELMNAVEVFSTSADR